ncbi:hypothetical protein CEG14_23655 [Bordetella genomosp. 1]|uniref:Lysozyme inhibitor LprI N-terminal domain-containing protein n=1 Tax=Bordetella genomosp. 1 TaxID=1395607 RepID=A0A261RW74_9BORD|nr:hypothetical protein [Bordetella genomosp. 1]OZI28922.1 hypothetical protein CEG14_23655 [Bordetella genomosp. 1]
MHLRSSAWILFAACSAFATPALAAEGPAFSCEHPRSKAERTICDFGNFAELDRSIALQYQRARGELDGATSRALTQDQERFVKVRDETHEDPGIKNTGHEELLWRLTERNRFMTSIDGGKRAGVVGKWQNLNGTLTVTQKPDGTLHVEGAAMQPNDGRWVCEIKADAPAQGEGAVFSDAKAEGWTLALARKGSGLAVTQAPGQGAKDTGHPPYCGAGGSFAGTYFPVR